jgi:hypothetical protein
MSTQPPPGVIPQLIRGHVELIHKLAAPLIGQGKVVVAGFGENPTQLDPKTGKPGRRLAPHVIHAVVGDVQQTLVGLSPIVKPHCNLYMPLAILRPDLTDGSKGYERDVVACLGIVADFDDPDAARWADRLPVPPNYVLETSAGRFQTFYLFEKPEAVSAAKPVAERLKAFARCDHGTSDMSHVWRVPGALNWPNAKKVAEGRAPDPQLVRIAKKWNGERISLQTLSIALPEGQPTVSLKKVTTSSSAAGRPRDDKKAEDQPASESELVMKWGLRYCAIWTLPTELKDEIRRPAGGDRSKALFRVIAKMLEAGLDDETIEVIIRAHPKGIGEKYKDRDDLDQEIVRVKAKTALHSQNGTLAPLISEMNEEYAVVDDNGKTVVIYRREDSDLQRKYVVKASYQDFRNLYLNTTSLVRDPSSGLMKLMSHADIWLRHPERRTYRGGLRFLPGTYEDPSDVYNLWTGWGMDPRPGDWSKMKEHINTVLCSGISEHCEYVINWLARSVQKPSVAGEVALVLRGARGTGKGIFARSIGTLFGQHFLHLSDAHHLTGNFNAHLRDACLVFADEAFYAGDKQHEGQLKRLVTEPTLMIEAKYANAVPVRNCLHLIVASNDDWVVPAGSDERRFFVLDVSSIRKKDYSYFEAIYEELKYGGYAGMLNDLLNLDISDFNVRSVPETAGLSDQKIRSLRGIEAWWYEILANGDLAGVVSDDGIYKLPDWTETQITVERPGGEQESAGKMFATVRP